MPFPTKLPLICLELTLFFQFGNLGNLPQEAARQARFRDEPYGG